MPTASPQKRCEDRHTGQVILLHPSSLKNGTAHFGFGQFLTSALVISSAAKSRIRFCIELGPRTRFGMDVSKAMKPYAPRALRYYLQRQKRDGNMITCLYFYLGHLFAPIRNVGVLFAQTACLSQARGILTGKYLVCRIIHDASKVAVRALLQPFNVRLFLFSETSLRTSL